MDDIGADVAVFALFGISSQELLAGFFAARRWARPRPKQGLPSIMFGRAESGKR